MTLSAADRWRLILGAPADETHQLDDAEAAMDTALDWLYERDEAGADADGGTGPKGPGGTSSRGLTTVDWLGAIGELFPKETIERLESDAINRYGLDDVLTDPEVLAHLEPNQSLLEAVLKTKHLMDPDVLSAARRIVERVVRQLVDQLRPEFRRSLNGVRSPRPTTLHRRARNFDFRSTVHHNLRYWDTEHDRLVIRRPHFHSRTQRHLDRRQVMMVVDQSGSMAGSVIHAAVTASILWSMPGVRPHLLAFDTRVVDLTDDVSDPVELLMKVQLGGGTDIAGAVATAADLIDDPRKAIVVLITDFFEGGSPGALVRTIGQLCDQGTTVLGLAALDLDAEPNYDRELAARCAEAGASVGAMTPGELAKFVADTIA